MGARRTPYELVFGPELEERFVGIQEEAEARGERLTTPEGFLLLGEVGAVLQDLLPEGDAAASAAAGEYGLLLYHAFQFWRFDKPIVVVLEDVARGLCALERTIGTWALLPAEPAGYVQLPQRLLWARVEPGAPPEPVDGFFWAAVGEADAKVPPFPRLDLLLILGMRRDRPGFSVAPVHEAWPVGGEGHWADAQARSDGDDFANMLPGGELDRLLALTTPLETLKLASRIFWYIAEGAPDGAIVEGEPGGDDADASGLPHRVLTWHGGDG